MALIWHRGSSWRRRQLREGVNEVREETCGCLVEEGRGWEKACGEGLETPVAEWSCEDRAWRWAGEGPSA